MTDFACRFAAALSTEERADAAFEATTAELASKLEGRPDLVVAFYTHHYGPAIDQFPAQMMERFQPRAFLGCTGESIVGNAREVENSAALVVWGARLPETSLTAAHLEFVRTAEGPAIVGWPESLSGEWPKSASLLLLGEPFSFPADWLLERLNAERPGLQVVGGMAGGAFGPGKNRVAVGERSYAAGAAALVIDGPVEVRAVVSQGCRPVGRSYVVTKAEQQMIQELAGKSPLAQLRDLYQELPAADRELVSRGVHVGRVIDEYKESFGRGDFLVRNVVGADRDSGSLAIADFVRRGQTVQFHVRDAVAADEDLRVLLAATRDEFRPQGGLLFTCNGRGSRLFDVPDHDARAVNDVWPELPLAGFFAQGEIGPVGGKNFMHGFTASLALFGPRSTKPPQ